MVKLSFIWCCRLLPLLLACCLCGACQPRKQPAAAAVEAASSLPRAHPGYVQWLERQSFLHRAQEENALLSSTLQLWATPPPRRLELLLHTAPTWLWAHTHTLRSRGSVAAAFSDTATLAALQNLGISGVYLAPLQEGNTVWGPQASPDAAPDDLPAAPAPDRRCGTEEELYRLSDVADQAGLPLGSDLLAAATGTGPDFQLALRHVREYPGIYAMLDLSHAPPSLLPPASTEAQPLSSAQVRALQDARLLPHDLERDHFPGATPGGWAVSGDVIGIDGISRRYAYRYAGTARHPVLSWEDPSGTARGMIGASAIHTVGLLRHSLAGIHAEAFWGLTPVAADSQASSQGEPLFAVLRELSRQTQRYGGWLAQMDPLPASLTAAVLATGTDFTWDSFSSPAAEYALLTQDAAPLRSLLDEAVRTGIDQRRLLRVMPGPSGISFRAFLARPEGATLRRTLLDALRSHDAVAFFQDETLYLSAPALAALICGLSPETMPAPQDVENLARVHLLLLAFRASLPGLFMLHGQDITGVLAPAAAPPLQRARGAWELTTGGDEGNALPAVAVYGTLATRNRQSGSYVETLQKLLDLRRRHAIAEARLKEIYPVRNRACLALRLQTPDGSQLLVVSNFSAQHYSEQFPLPDGTPASGAWDLLHDRPLDHQGTALVLSLSPWEYRLIQLNRQARP